MFEFVEEGRNADFVETFKINKDKLANSNRSWSFWIYNKQHSSSVALMLFNKFLLNIKLNRSLNSTWFDPKLNSIENNSFRVVL